MLLRAHAVTATALAAFAFVAPGVAHADAVRVAVVGFTGDLSAQELTDLAVSMRGSLTRQADPKVLTVVTREEMAAVYGQRGGACYPEDRDCLVDASDAWAGRLFIRGVARKTSEGLIVSATLESVRGVLVAASQTPPSPKWNMDTAVPVLVRELLDGEKAYRKRNFSQPPPTAPLVATNAAASASANAAHAAPSNAGGPVACRCLAIEPASVPGDLRADENGMRFDGAATSATKLQWRYGWAKVARAEAVKRGTSPAVQLASSTGDVVTLAFNAAGDRDKCLAAINVLRLQAQRPR